MICIGFARPEGSKLFDFINYVCVYLEVVVAKESADQQSACVFIDDQYASLDDQHTVVCFCLFVFLLYFVVGKGSADQQSYACVC